MRSHGFLENFLTGLERLEKSSMIDVFWVDSVVLAMLTDVFVVFVPTEGLAHVERIFRIPFTSWVVAVIAHDSPIHAIATKKQNLMSIESLSKTPSISFDIPHFLVHVYCRLVRDSDEEIHEPSIFLLTRLVETSSKSFSKAHLPVLWSHSEGGDMTMPR